MYENEEYETISLIVAFLNKIGLLVEYISLDDSPISGVFLADGKLYVDRDKLLYPGELLFKAGQMAVVSPDERVRLNGESIHESSDEMMVIAWCWAALIHLNLSPEVIFYNRNSSCPTEVIDKFNTGRFWGVPLLQWAGMSNEPTRALGGEMIVFPAMIKWLRD